MLEAPQNPGSINQFRAAHPEATDHDHAVAVSQYRAEIAAFIGVTLPELHQMGPINAASHIAAAQQEAA